MSVVPGLVTMNANAAVCVGPLGTYLWLLVSAESQLLKGPSPEESGIVIAIINMGRSLKLRVIAEGEESREEMEFLRAHHCDDAQGFYFSRPVPPHQFTALLDAALATGATK